MYIFVMAFAPSSSRAFTKRSIPGRWGAYGRPTAASLTTSLAGTNDDLVFTARSGGLRGNSLGVEYVVSGRDTELSVRFLYSSGTVVVNLATDSEGAATSTAGEVADAVNRAGVPVTAEDADSNDGTGVVAAMARRALTGGTLWNIGTNR